MMRKPDKDYDALAATEEILQKTYDKQLAVINAQREQITQSAMLVLGWIDQLLGLCKMLIALSVTAIVGSLTVELKDVDTDLLAQIGVTVLFISSVGIAILLSYRMRLSTPFLRAQAATTEYLVELSKTLRLYNQYIDSKYSKAKRVKK